MEYQVLSLNIGQPKTYQINNRELNTGFVKHAVTDSVWLSKHGFEGDGQADLKNHGGEEKALLMYPFEHYSYWNNRYNKNFSVPAFGENITIVGLLEHAVFAGNIYSLGEAIVQVSQPRQPCYKIAEIHRVKDIPAVVTETGYSGYYFRVLKEGYVSNDDTLKLLEEEPNKISIAFIFGTLFHKKADINRIQQILKVDTIANSLRKSLVKRLSKLSV
ncbi:MOSC domain-containing protein [Aquibacillus rhizosphaerae]|uniref:MOSC domain-containing protein n=1 Tax=Aquibacillus rhizosphaerae TaxID=3051431 RepID=A0ABT7L9F4_9BACI|nr:MOSC domain-containing protein [Aquibacillus sp. LR5S19]MDL4841820.1 MOSC domain-containing protein [Aquibacillus sp. LR5S19]